MKILLDTNALIDFVAGRVPYDEDIRKLCIAATFGDVQIWVNVHSYTDAYYVLCKHSQRQEVKRALLSTLELFLVCGASGADVRAALESDYNDIEDYLIAASAKQIPADYFITRDKELLTCLAQTSSNSLAGGSSKTDPRPKSRLHAQAMTAHDFLDFLATERGLTYAHIDL